ncbi:MAG: hypothetical protein LBD97_03050 [Bifidobacteriaceae bacterium]|nr:hypothetical protein [Bifidobacteriaceae bacterium]
MKLSLKIRAGGLAAVGVVALGTAGLVLVGCAGDGEPSGTGSPTTQSAQSAPPSAAAVERDPGVTGAIAAVTDSLLQVQDSEKQTAVAYSAETVITEQVAGTAADVVVGSCVVATGQAAASADGATAEQETFAAATVTVTPAEADGACAGAGFGAGGGQPGVGGGDWQGGLPGDMPSGGAQDRPSGMPDDMPSGFPSGMPFDDQSGDSSAGPGFSGGGAPGGGMLANMAFGLVTAVDGDTVTVDQSAQPTFGGQGGATPSAEGQAAAATRSFTIAEAEITTTKTTDSSALRVGRCVVAQGETSSSGQVSAESLMVSDPGEDGCTSASRGFTAGQRGGAAGARNSGGGAWPPDSSSQSLPGDPSQSGRWPGPGASGDADAGGAPDGWARTQDDPAVADEGDLI